MRSWSLRVGKFFGIEVFIHWTFWILIVWIFLLHMRGSGDLLQGLWGALFILTLFCCIVLHEFGHALTARRFGVQTRDITLYPIGGIASLEGMPEKPGQELLVGLAGPAVNIVIAAILYLYLSSTGQLIDIEEIATANETIELPFVWSLMFANFVLAAFNLIPAFPMDGGRVLRSILSFFTERANATRIAAGIGQFLAIVFVFLGFFYNFWLVFIGLFIFLGAGGEAAQEKLMSALSGLTVKDALMHRFTTLAPETSLSTVVDALLNSQETEFIITDGLVPVGLLSRNEIIRGLAEEGGSAPASRFMNRNFLVTAPDTALPELLREMLVKGHSVSLVMEDDRLLGLIDRENIEEKLEVQEVLKRRNEI